MIPRKYLFSALTSFAATTLSITAATTIGMNFADQWESTQLEGETADGFSGWTDSPHVDGDNSSGSDVLLIGSNDLVTVTWDSKNKYAGGSESNPEQGLYRVYLDDGNVDDSGIGVRVTITGLSAWMAAEGLTAYQIRTYASTDSSAATSFHDVSVRDGSSIDDNILDTIEVPFLGNGQFPTNPEAEGGGKRGFGDSNINFTADTITLTLPQGAGNTRGTLAAFKITGVPEPSSLCLLSLAGLGFLRRRR